MKYPISLNEKEIQDLQEIGRALGIEKLSSIYGGVAKVIKYSIALTKQTTLKIEKDIPDLDPDTLDILLSSIRKIKTDKYYKQKQESKENKAKLV